MGKRVVNQLRSQIDVVFHDLRHRNVVLDDVAEQVEKGKYLDHRDQTEERHDEVEEKARQYVAVEYLKDGELDPARARRLRGVCATSVRERARPSP